MPSENRRPKDDTWTSAELNKALKSTKDNPDRTKKRRDDSERRHHREELKSSDHRKEDERRSKRREEDEKNSKKHKDRDEPGEKIELSEEDRERLRQERRARRGGTTEEKKPKVKESRAVVEDDGKKQKHRDRGEDEEGRSERRKNQEEESLKHREDRDRERRRHEREKERMRQEEDEKDHRRHRNEDVDDERKRRHKEESSSGRHHDGDKHHKRKDEVENEDDRERRRQERREQHEKEKLKDKLKDSGKDYKKEKSKDREKHSDKGGDRDKYREKDREHKERSREEDKNKNRERGSTKNRDSGDHGISQSRSFNKDGEDSKRQRTTKSEDFDSDKKVRQEMGKEKNSKYTKEEKKDDTEDEYNYEEDFEDYDDDFEDDDNGDEDEEDDDFPQKRKGGEMEDVLRALDKENSRVASSISHRSDRSASTDYSGDYTRETKEDYVTPAKSQPKTFINFVSAKQRVMDHTVAGRARKRFEDLSKLIELDVSKFDMFDLPPVKEYELYIRSFGRSDTKQAYIQTRDDDIDRDIQTEEVENLSKWTQHPPDNEIAVGGEGINVQTDADRDKSSGPTDPERLNKFLSKVGQFLFTILDEESKSSSDEEKRKDHKSKVSFSKKSFHLGSTTLLKGYSVTSLSFCQSEPNFLLSVHVSLFDVTKQQPNDQWMSYICVWNLTQPAYPYRLCGSEMKITSACFSPTRATLVFAGMLDGSLALWDLRETGSQHRNIKINEHEHLVRFPTYNTARVLESENHQSSVVAIVPVYSQVVGSHKDESVTESKSGYSFQLASIDETAVLNMWVVAEIAVPDAAGSETDLGLAPGGKMKLLRSSSICLTNPHKFVSTHQGFKANDLRLNPSDLNHYYVGSDSGCVVHGVRFGKRAYPQFYSSLIDSPVPIVSIDFTPFGQPYFLAASKDGTLYLFNTKIDKPIATWREFITGETILTVRWSHSRPAVFYVLDSSSAVYTFDLVENGLAPVKMDRITLSKARCFEVGSDPNLLANGANKPAHMACAAETGEIEIFTVSEDMRQQQNLEEEFLACYVDRF